MSSGPSTEIVVHTTDNAASEANSVAGLLGDLSAFAKLTAAIASGSLPSDSAVERHDWHFSIDLPPATGRNTALEKVPALPRNEYGLEDLSTLYAAYRRAEQGLPPVEKALPENKSTVNVSGLELKYARLSSELESDSECTEEDMELEVLRRRSEAPSVAPSLQDLGEPSFLVPSPTSSVENASPINSGGPEVDGETLELTQNYGTEIGADNVARARLSTNVQPRKSILKPPRYSEQIQSNPRKSVVLTNTSEAGAVIARKDSSKSSAPNSVSQRKDSAQPSERRRRPIHDGRRATVHLGMERTVKLSMKSRQSAPRPTLLDRCLEESQACDENLDDENLEHATATKPVCGPSATSSEGCAATPVACESLVPPSAVSLDPIAVSAQNVSAVPAPGAPIISESPTVANEMPAPIPADVPIDPDGELVYGYTSTASPGSRRVSCLSSIGVPGSRRVSMDVGLQPVLTSEDITPDASELRAARRRSTNSIRHGSTGPQEELGKKIAGFIGVRRGRSCAFTCNTGQKTFDLVVEDGDIDDGEGSRGVQCSAADIDAAMDVLFADPEDLSVPDPAKTKKDAAVQWTSEYEEGMEGHLYVISPQKVGGADATEDLPAECLPDTKERTVLEGEGVSAKCVSTASCPGAGGVTSNVDVTEVVESDQQQKTAASQLPTQKKTVLPGEEHFIARKPNNCALSSDARTDESIKDRLGPDLGNTDKQEKPQRSSENMPSTRNTARESLCFVEVETPGSILSKKASEEFPDMALGGDEKTEAAQAGADRGERPISTASDVVPDMPPDDFDDDDNHEEGGDMPPDDFDDDNHEEGAHFAEEENEDEIIFIDTPDKGQDESGETALPAETTEVGQATERNSPAAPDAEESEMENGLMSPAPLQQLRRSTVLMPGGLDVRPNPQGSEDPRPVTPKKKRKPRSKEPRKAAKSQRSSIMSRRDSSAVEIRRLGLTNFRVPPVEGDQEDVCLDDIRPRRSKRKRFPPLQYWKNEKKVYNRRMSQIMPTISEVVVAVDGKSDAENDLSWASVKARKVVGARR